MPIVTAGLISAGVGLLGSGVGAATGVGRNDTQTTTFGQTKQYDPNKFQYGGMVGGADAAAGRYRWGADQAQTRQAPQADYTYAGPDYRGAHHWDAMGGYSRDAQSNMAQLMARRAQGLVPSIAQMQADRQMQQATAAQASQAASARGAGGMALAQQNAANNIAGAHGAISNQAQINAAQERLAAEQGAYGAFSGMRAGDMRAAQDQAQRAQYGANLGTQQQQYNANLRLLQGGQNDRMSEAYTGFERGVNQDQLRAGMGEQALLAGSFDQQQGLRQRQGEYNANREMDMFKGAMGAVQGAAGMAMPTGGAPAAPTSGVTSSTPMRSANIYEGLASGGQMHKGRTYLVGEEGPEVIVAQRDGYVIPHHMLGMLEHREDGGPVEEGKPYVVGEAGKEGLVPAHREAANIAEMALSPAHIVGWGAGQALSAPNEKVAEGARRAALVAREAGSYIMPTAVLGDAAAKAARGLLPSLKATPTQAENAGASDLATQRLVPGGTGRLILAAAQEMSADKRALLARALLALGGKK